MENDFEEEADDKVIDEEKGTADSPWLDKVKNELMRLNTFKNRNIKDVVGFAMVGGTDNDYVNPISFQDAW